MPVEFLTDDEAPAHGRYAGPSQADLERVFFLDGEHLAIPERWLELFDLTAIPGPVSRG